jgi:hypothetical protein
MQAYTTPGVTIEQVLTEPARVLRTGVPVFLGLVRTEHLQAHNAQQLKPGETFVCKPLRDHPGVTIVRKRGYLSLPKRTFASGTDSRVSDRSSNDLSLYLKVPTPTPPARLTASELQLIRSSAAVAGQIEPLPELSIEELHALSEKPQRFTIWPQFEQTYGDLKPFGFLSYAVRGFFENGGSLCYVQIICYDGDSTNTAAKALEAGLASLAPYDDYDLVCAPDIMWPDGMTTPDPPGQMDLTDLQRAVLEHCEQLGDRMAILDSLRGADSHTVLAQRRTVCGTNGALYYPWVRVVDGPPQTGRYVPPCGHMAGVIARCDQRVGVHKAPANEVLEGVLELETVLSDEEQGPLNEENVNCFRAFPRRGLRVWGARTLSGSSIWRYINERRVILTAIRWIDRNLADVPFEPHTPLLWGRIVRELTAYFSNLARLGALSAPPDGEAFYVKCDAETNPQEVREAGMIVTEIGLRPGAPAEFIVLRILHGPTGVRVEEPEA